MKKLAFLALTCSSLSAHATQFFDCGVIDQLPPPTVVAHYFIEVDNTNSPMTVEFIDIQGQRINKIETAYTPSTPGAFTYETFGYKIVLSNPVKFTEKSTNKTVDCAPSSDPTPKGQPSF